MRRFGGLSISLALIFPFVAQAAAIASDWQYLNTADNGNALYIDKSSLRRQGKTVWYWTYSKYKVPDADNVVATTNFFSGNCQTREFRVRVIVDYDAQGEVFSSIDNGNFGKLYQAVPGTVGALALEHACKIPIKN